MAEHPCSLIDGLVFYSQFSELAPHQIVLVTIGIAVLLLGVWSVSAVKADTGEGGVQLGSWADEADLTDDEEEASPIWSEAFTDEPGGDGLDHSNSSALATQEDVARTPPLSPLVSPRRRRSSGYQARYGTLIPELAPPGMPAGFSIGFNTSSPGFALRRHHHHHEHANSDGEALGRQIRSSSEPRTGKRASSLDGGTRSAEARLASSLTQSTDGSGRSSLPSGLLSSSPEDVPNPKSRS